MSEIALVTGCSSGIGLATAIELAKDGKTTYASMRDLSKKDKLETAAQEAGVQVKTIELDVSNQDSVTKAIQQIKNEQGRVDVLVNNAGYGMFGSIESTSMSEFQEQLNTDFFGAVRTTKEVLPIMREQESGHIINISSVAGFMGFPIVPAYVSSKYALEGFTECLRHELFEEDEAKMVHAVLVEPGVVNTNFYNNMKIAADANKIPKYAKILEGMLKAGEQLFAYAMGPEQVAKKVIKVLHEKNPEPRYRVGNDSNQYWADKTTQTPLKFEETIRSMLNQMTNPEEK